MPIDAPTTLLGRVPMREVRSLDDVVAFVESTRTDNVVIFDVDNTLAPQGVAPSEFVGLVNAAIDRVEANRFVAQVIALTNGAQRGVSRVMGQGNKPWTSRRRLGLGRSGAPVVVVGDQVITDGLLACRLRATFLHLVIDDVNEDRRQAVMRRLGRMVVVVLFRQTA